MQTLETIGFSIGIGLIVWGMYKVGYEAGRDFEKVSILSSIRRMDLGHLSTETRYKVLRVLDTVCTRIYERK